MEVGCGGGWSGMWAGSRAPRCGAMCSSCSPATYNTACECLCVCACVLACISLVTLRANTSKSPPISTHRVPELNACSFARSLLTHCQHHHLQSYLKHLSSSHTDNPGTISFISALSFFATKFVPLRKKQIY